MTGTSPPASNPPPDIDLDAPILMPSRPAGRPQGALWPNLSIIAAVLLVTLGSFAASFWVKTTATQLVRQQVIGPITTSSGSPRSVSISGGRIATGQTAFQVHLRFQADQLIPHETVFHVGSPSTGISAVLSTAPDGFSSVRLQSLDSLDPFSAVLVNQVATGQVYSLEISVDNGRMVTASTDGQPQFTYSYLHSNLVPHLSGATIGAGVRQASPLQGTVSDFAITVQHYRVSGSANLVLALRTLAGLLLSLVIVLCIIRFATGRRVAGWLNLASAKDEAPKGWAHPLRQHSTLLGVVLLSGGIATLAVVTPLDNAVLQKSGTQYFSASSVGPHESSSYSLGGEPRLMREAAALDVNLTYQIKVTRSNPPRFGFPVAVSTFGDNHGLMFEVVKTNGVWQLISLVGGDGRILPPIQRLLLSDIQLHKWVVVDAVVQRSQSFRYFVNGLPVETFTWNLPILNAAPTHVYVNGTFGGSVRDLSMTVALFRVNPDRVPYLLVRSAQGLALLAIIASTILLSRRFLSKFLPTVQTRKPLVLVTFWTMGVGIVLNVVVDLLHFQQDTPYGSRNSWLLSQYPRFNDFFQVYEILRSFNPYGIQGGNYPPLGYWLAAPFIWLNEYAALMTMIAVTVAFIAWWSYRSFASGFSVYGRILVVAVTLFSLPVTMAVDRANEDLIIFILVVFGIAALERQRPALAATWIGVAAAAKIYPLAYLLLFLRGRRVRYLFLGISVAALATLFGFATFRGSLMGNFDGFKSAYSGLQTQMAGGIGATYYNASIPAWLRGIGYAAEGGHGLQLVGNAIQPFILPVEAIAGLVLAAYLRWCEQSLWRAVTLITAFFLLFSNLSNYYELLLVFIALALFVKYAQVNRRGLIIAVLFGLVMAPRAYFYLGNSMIDVSVLTTAPILFGLAVAVVIDGHCERNAAKEVRALENRLDMPPVHA